jgi:hypothetical protein
MSVPDQLRAVGLQALRITLCGGSLALQVTAGIMRGCGVLLDEWGDRLGEPPKK